MSPADTTDLVAVPIPDETRALSRLGFEELDLAVGGLGRLHRGIAERAFSAVGPAGRPVQIVHDAISAGVYGGVRGATALLSRGADAVLARRPPPGDGRPVSTHPRGGSLLGILNGLTGDELERRASDLQEPMAVRVNRRAISVEEGALRAAFPAPRARIAVFLHGLMETEGAWKLGGGPTYGERLEHDLDLTAVEIRVNSGRHISENGRALADLLETLVAAWPVGVEEMALIGHSMGGLMVRSACFAGSGAGHRWPRLVRHVVSLGTPHTGAPLEQAVHWASAGLHALPETRPIANFLRRRSAGIRDLRQGSLVDEDWRDCDPDALRAAAVGEVPLHECATHCFVSATVTRSPRHPVGRLVGDWLVLQPSATGRSRTRRIPFEEEHGMHVGGASHFALLNHPAVYARLRGWLAMPPGSVAEPSGLPAPDGAAIRLPRQAEAEAPKVKGRG